MRWPPRRLGSARSSSPSSVSAAVGFPTRRTSTRASTPGSSPASSHARNARNAFFRTPRSSGDLSALRIRAVTPFATRVLCDMSPKSSPWRWANGRASTQASKPSPSPPPPGPALYGCTRGRVDDRCARRKPGARASVREISHRSAALVRPDVPPRGCTPVLACPRGPLPCRLYIGDVGRVVLVGERGWEERKRARAQGSDALLRDGRPRGQGRDGRDTAPPPEPSRIPRAPGRRAHHGAIVRRQVHQGGNPARIPGLPSGTHTRHPKVLGGTPGMARATSEHGAPRPRPTPVQSCRRRLRRRR